MNKKEISELRRRFSPDKNSVGHIYGCYVNTKKEIIAYLDESLAAMPPEEAEKYLGLLKKALSGTQGKNLIDIVFSTQQVADSPEHKLLMSLRESELKDPAVRQAFYDKVIESLDMDDSNYLVLLGHDAYDVPFKAKDGLTFDSLGHDVPLHGLLRLPGQGGQGRAGLLLGPERVPQLRHQPGRRPAGTGVCLPAFDDRAANIYNALFYTRKPDQIHQEFIDGVFRVEPPMSAAEQRETFETILSESLGDACTLQLAQNLYEWVQDKVEKHKESREEEPLAVTAADLTAVLLDSQVPEAQVQAFAARFARASALPPL